jgi:hypothetical protein
MNYLLLNAEKICAIKIKTQAGRLRVNKSRRTISFPKTISFWSPVRPVPNNSYQIKLRGIGLAELDIKTVFGELAGGGFLVNADLTRQSA